MGDALNSHEPTAEVDLTGLGTSPFVGKGLPLGGVDGSDSEDDDNALTRLQERLEDARDAIVESETFEYVYSFGCKAADAGRVVWSLTKTTSWILGTSALVLVVPLLYEMDKELNLAGMTDGVPELASDAPAATDVTAKSS
jgi:hypothetical protein